MKFYGVTLIDQDSRPVRPSLAMCGVCSALVVVDVERSNLAHHAHSHDRDLWQLVP